MLFFFVRYCYFVRHQPLILGARRIDGCRRLLHRPPPLVPLPQARLGRVPDQDLLGYQPPNLRDVVRQYLHVPRVPTAPCFRRYACALKWAKSVTDLEGTCECQHR
jgi:hypothetical protein